MRDHSTSIQRQIVGWDEANEKQAKKLVAREAERLRISFESAREAGFRKYINVSPLSANKYRGRGEYLHADGRRVRSGACCIFPLPRRVPLRRQYPRSSPWDPVSPGFWRLLNFSLKRSWIRSSTGTVEYHIFMEFFFLYAIIVAHLHKSLRLRRKRKLFVLKCLNNSKSKIFAVLVC